MTNMIHGSQLDVSVLSSSDLVSAEVRDRRPDTVSLFAVLSEEQREQMVHDAWSIGLRALRNAHAEAQESRLQDVGAALASDIDRQLRSVMDDGHAELLLPQIVARRKEGFTAEIAEDAEV